MAYTAQQLVALACEICKIPGKTSFVGQMLNIVLADYAQTMDLDTIRKTATLNIAPQAVTPWFYPLPSDYLRMSDGDIFYNVLGEVFTPSQFSLQELDASYTNSGIANYPTKWATDISQNPQPTAGTSPSLAFYPPPAVPLSVTVRYRPQTSDIVTPETSSTVPWFPNQRVLLIDLCVESARIADDDRAVGWEQEVARRVDKYLQMKDDQEGYSLRVQLDPNQFRANTNLPPSKKLGF